MIIDYKFVEFVHRNILPRLTGAIITIQAILTIGLFFTDGSIGWWALFYFAVSIAITAIIFVSFPVFYQLEGGRVFVRQFYKKRELKPETIPGCKRFNVINIGNYKTYGHRFKGEEENFEMIYLTEAENPPIIEYLNSTNPENTEGQ